MLLKLGTYKYHVIIEILYYRNRHLNLFGIVTPLFAFVISLWEPAIFGEWKYPSRKFHKKWTSKKR